MNWHVPVGCYRLPLLVVLLALSYQISAQSFPSKPIRFIVAFAPGGGTDTVARVLATTLSDRWRQQVVVDNRPGGATIIATEITSRSSPDGHTFLIVDPSFSINPGLFAKLPYDPIKSFEPVTVVASFPLMLVVHPSIQAKSVGELIQLARDRPRSLSYASAGIGSSTHMAPEIMKATAGIDIVHVPYKGGGPAVVDLIAGQVSMGFAGIPAVLPHVQAGRLRAIAVSSEKRSLVVPDIPTVAESGLPGYEVISWQGIFTPAGVPNVIVHRLQKDLAEVAHLPNVRSRMAALGAEPVGNTPEQFAEYLRSQIASYSKVIKAAGIRAE